MCSAPESVPSRRLCGLRTCKSVGASSCLVVLGMANLEITLPLEGSKCFTIASVPAEYMATRYMSVCFSLQRQ